MHVVTAPTPDRTRRSPEALGLIDTSAVCELLQMSRPTLGKILADKARDFPKRIRLGHKFYYRETAVEDWVARELGLMSDQEP
ncbi:helix-turn-helix transcriptional regulator [Hyphomicrobium sp. 2TAF46]|uniref:helix-turn-helix transcriptional regulator n=1 Tax=Hyphomicrobium sp. 2TAF46 TaxID=3233019 RepID=UPI003F907F9E